MKVIFLDFDGVINNWDHFDDIDNECVAILKHIKETTNSIIVATTSNKYSFQAHNANIEFTKFFETVLKLKKQEVEINDVTPLVNKNRCLEIKEYLDKHPQIEHYLILDDEYIDDSLKEHQVFLDLYNGLQKEHIKPSIDILNGKLGFYPPNYNTKETPEELNIRINHYHLSKKINKNNKQIKNNN